MPTADTADEFLALAAQYQLGALDTEGFHPLTENLSALAQNDLPAALRTLQAVDVAALDRAEPGHVLPHALAFGNGNSVFGLAETDPQVAGVRLVGGDGAEIGIEMPGEARAVAVLGLHGRGQQQRAEQAQPGGQ